MANKAYEIAFLLGAQIQSSFNTAFTSANNQIEEVGGGLANAAGTAAKFGAGISLAAGAAGLAVAGLAVNVTDDLQKALNGMQSATGTADSSMKGYKDSMLAIYNNNFGEDFADIGTAMTEVAQGTGLAGKALETTTQNALLLRDTFGFEVTDSVRGADALMKQFGLTSGSAFNLMTAGAQAGLNKNDDLLDTLNEYSGTFAAQGFNATEMFNMLSNASKSGVRDVDLAADAIKEFGIRSKDGSTTSAAGFEALGLNASKLTKAFAQGGDAGRNAFKTVTDKLTSMKDPVAQTAAGVALFGTQFEDLGIKGITALSKTSGSISDVKDHIEELNATKYNTLGEAMVGIKRNLETGILIPIGDKILPILTNFSDYIVANMPQIKSNISDAMVVAGNVFTGTGDIITNYVMPPLESLWAWIQPNMPLIKDSVQVAMDGIKTAFNTTSDGVSALIDWCTKYQNILIPLAAGITAGALTFGIYSAAIGIAAFATTAWAAITSIATIAGTAFGAVLAFITSPIGIVVIAIGLLVAAGVLLYRNWDTVKAIAMNVFGAIGSFVGGVVDGIASGFKGMVNGVIGGLNSMIRALNGLHFSIPDWVPILGGKDFGLNIPQIPQLANGGYIKHRPGGVLANIGEGSEDEVVSPVSKLKNMMSSSSKTSTNNADQPIQVTYSPQIIIQGNADMSIMEAANKKGFDDFENKYNALRNKKQRLSFNRG